MLDAIIDLVFGNIVFAVLIIGGLISFFKRLLKKTYEEQSEQPRSYRQTESTNKDISAEKRRTTARMGRSMKSSSDLQVAIETTHSELEAVTDQGKTTRKPIRQNVKRARNVSHKSERLLPDQNQVAQGIIWSEVLGPPRARKPHRTMSRMR